MLSKYHQRKTLCNGLKTYNVLVQCIFRELPGNSTTGVSHDDPSSLIPLGGQGIPVQRTSSVLATKGSFKRNRKSDNETKDENFGKENGSKLNENSW